MFLQRSDTNVRCESVDPYPVHGKGAVVVGHSLCNNAVWYTQVNILRTMLSDKLECKHIGKNIVSIFFCELGKQHPIRNGDEF